MTLSEDFFHRAQKIIPGGVNSPVRAFKGVGGNPIFFKSGQGAYLTDVDDNAYIDYVGSWGPLILGHCHPAVLQAVTQVLPLGMSFGAPTELEILLAEKITRLMPSLEKIRMVNSGTEATMTAIRLARGFTQKNKIIKFNGCYHGHNDSLLVKAGSGALTLGLPSTPGIPESITEHTLIANFNDIDTVAQIFSDFPSDIAAVIIEPIAGNMGFVLPDEHFLSSVHELCQRYQTLFIFDEVMTGFRVDLGGAQALYKIVPDLTTLGKIIGGGMPVGAIGGRAEIMNHLAPLGPVYQAGTLSGNPLAMAAGLATLDEIEKPGFYEKLNQHTQQLVLGLAEIANSVGIPLITHAVGGMFGFCFTAQKSIRNYQDVATGDEVFFKRFYHEMLKNGVYFAPSMYEAGFVSGAHGAAEIEKTLQAAQKAFDNLAT